MEPIRSYEEACGKCNRPIYTGDGRYRFSEWGTICEFCRDETKEERMSGVIL